MKDRRAGVAMDLDKGVSLTVAEGALKGFRTEPVSQVKSLRSSSFKRPSVILESPDEESESRRPALQSGKLKGVLSELKVAALEQGLEEDLPDVPASLHLSKASDHQTNANVQPDRSELTEQFPSTVGEHSCKQSDPVPGEIEMQHSISDERLAASMSELKIAALEQGLSPDFTDLPDVPASLMRKSLDKQQHDAVSLSQVSTRLEQDVTSDVGQKAPSSWDNSPDASSPSTPPRLSAHTLADLRTGASHSAALSSLGSMPALPDVPQSLSRRGQSDST
jgi:hypothetical protein